MRFLIEYDRQRRELVTFKPFPDTEKRLADEERLALELRRKSDGLVREILVLDADSETALRVTHNRYFEDWLAPEGRALRVAESPPRQPGS